MGLRWVAVAALGVAVAGCQSGPQARADSVAVLGEAFTVAGGEQVTISDIPLRLRFTEVLEDSRCPTEVECVWTGQARVAVSVEQGADAPATVEFNTNPAPGQNRQAVDVGGFTVSLRQLKPYPRTPDDATALADYQATMVVQRAHS